jgi:hypothetical protein
LGESAEPLLFVEGLCRLLRLQQLLEKVAEEPARVSLFVVVCGVAILLQMPRQTQQIRHMYCPFYVWTMNGWSISSKVKESSETKFRTHKSMYGDRNDFYICSKMGCGKPVYIPDHKNLEMYQEEGGVSM